jgi:hypothetical protein
MPEAMLGSSTAPIDLGDGYTIVATDVRGTVAAEPRGDSTRSFDKSDLDVLLQTAGLRHEKSVTLRVAPPLAPPGAGARDVAPRAVGRVAFQVPHRPEERPLVLIEDELGALRWQLPQARGAPVAAGAVGFGPRGLQTFSTFDIAIREVPVEDGARGLLDVGKKVLKVFVYPVVDAILGPIVQGFARRWEEHNRPYLARAYGPTNYKGDPNGAPPLSGGEWQRLAGGRALLFVHGTFSSCGAFSVIAPEVMQELARRYGDRTFAFNHFTMSDDPRQNALRLLQQVPPGVQLDVDIICHSRGGLVARELARIGAGGAGGGTIRVGSIVLVGVPNAGTALASDDHMVEMIDRFTTIAHLIPPGAVRSVVDALVLVLKLVGHGLLHDLAGLRAMNPSGPFLPTLNEPGSSGPTLFAIAADFEPKAGTPWFSLTRAEDAAMDAVFEQTPNDLVVPRDGVYAGNGAPGFPVPAERQLVFVPGDGVIHTEYFSFARTQQQLLSWLQANAEGARAFSAVGASWSPPASQIDLMARVLDDFRNQALALLASRDGAGAARGIRAPDLSPAELSALRPHVIDLREGKFRRGGSYYTPQSDVDAIFETHIPAWLDSRPQAEPLRLVVYAHGGLTGERDGLTIAHKHVEWWKQNGVYPLYFVWETGLFDALGSILESVASRIPGLGRRDLWDYTTDPMVEVGCRALGGVKIWGAMKQFAGAASAPEGGALYVADKLAAYCRQPAARPPVELHAVGHSAGSIFHAHFLPAAMRQGVPAFRTLQLLAPAIRVDEFKERLLPLVGQYAQQLSVFTMLRHYEEADNCGGVYRKSLLYLIYNALEPERNQPILGLEMSIRGDSQVKRALGLDGTTGQGEVVWSVTGASTGRSASQSSSHGGFDDDAATMSSVVARVLGEPNAPVAYRGAAGASRSWSRSTDWLEQFDVTGFATSVPLASAAETPRAEPIGAASFVSRPVGAPSSPSPPTASQMAKPSTSTVVQGGGSTGGRRLALCIGIDRYSAPYTLAGCVNDANAWKQALGGLGFEVSPLMDGQATHAAITQQLRAMISGAQSGDVIVMQYAGHGTELPDLSGDEASKRDQALVPFDYEEGAFLIDDDLRAIFQEIRPGVSLTVFADCCHSGTITRLFAPNAALAATGSRPRFLIPSQEQIRAHRRFRESLRSRALARDIVDRSAIRWVSFAACHDTESAYETSGSGDFTRLAVPILRGNMDGITNRQFQEKVLASFGEGRRQSPQLDCAEEYEMVPVFGTVP